MTGSLTIWSIPVLAAPSTDSASAKVLVFGDPDGHVIGLRTDLELATTDDFKFDYNLRSFRALLRAGSKMRTSSTTLKPFAVLTLAAA